MNGSDQPEQNIDTNTPNSVEQVLEADLLIYTSDPKTIQLLLYCVIDLDHWYGQSNPKLFV